MVMFCLMWCLWREKIDRSFEDRKMTVVELKISFFNALYYWTTAFDYFNISDFRDFPC